MIEHFAMIALLGIGILVAGVWVFVAGTKKGSNLQRLVGGALFIVGLVAAAPSAGILILFWLWASGDSYY